MNMINARAVVYWMSRYRLFYGLVVWLRKRQLISDHEERTRLAQGKEVKITWPADIRKPTVGIVNEYGGTKVNPICYWTKYRRLCEVNDIPYGLLDIHRSDFMEQAKKYDLIVWHTMSDVASQQEAETKITLLEKHVGVTCLPSTDEIWFYEDKVRQAYLFKAAGIKAPHTFISHDREEAFEYIKKCSYPIVSKIATGSSSLGVRMIKNRRQARSLCERVFSTGADTCWGYSKQKDYVYFQEYIPDVKADLRVIVVGDSYFGYYRMAPKGDFRASGGGLVIRDAIPVDALRLARKVKQALPLTRMLAVDFLQTADDQYYVAETSIFIRVDTCEQLHEGGRPGRYVDIGDDFVFEEGRYWVQELALAELMNEYLVASQGKNTRLTDKPDQRVGS